MWSEKHSLCEALDKFLLNWGRPKSSATTMRDRLNGDFEMRFGWMISERVVAAHDDLSL